MYFCNNKKRCNCELAQYKIVFISTCDKCNKKVRFRHLNLIKKT